MNLKSKVFQPLLLSGFISIMGVGSTAQAQVRSSLHQCFSQVRTQYDQVVSEFETERNVRLATAVPASVVGLFLSGYIYSIMRDDSGGGAAFGFGGLVLLASSTGATSAFGTASVLGYRVATTDQEDVLRTFRSTPIYSCLTLELGRNRAEALLADLAAGWTMERLTEKYLNAHDQELLRQNLHRESMARQCFQDFSEQYAHYQSSWQGATSALGILVGTIEGSGLSGMGSESSVALQVLRRDALSHLPQGSGIRLLFENAPLSIFDSQRLLGGFTQTSDYRCIENQLGVVRAREFADQAVRGHLSGLKWEFLSDGERDLIRGL